MIQDQNIKITLPDGEVFELPARVDEHGVLRYIKNDLIDKAFDSGLFDLNAIIFMCHRKKVVLKDQIIIWSMLGYSVDGMCDCSFMFPVKVETLEWTKEPQTDEDE